MLVDSHCHLDFDEFRDRIPEVLAEMAAAGVSHALCISVTLTDFPRVRALAERHGNLFATVGVHPDYPDAGPVAVDELLRLADHPRIVAIGETGLDYYRLQGDLEWQRERFRTHIRAARECGKPLVVHTRAAAEDTLRILREERAAEVGGVMHCFTETLDVARAAVDLGFLISFSGIVTFKNATALRATARALPLDRILVETDAPYLAPVPHRGKTNQPAFVRFVAEEVARAREEAAAVVAAATSRNFAALFHPPDFKQLLQYSSI
jgi:TatD DNase family protein